MEYPLIPSGIHLYYDASFIKEVDRVLDLNLSQPLEQVAYMMSLLRKGIQNLTNDNERVRNEDDWSTLSYTIDNIGIVLFHLIQDAETRETFIQITGIRWTLKDSSFFKDFLV